jgi:two-component system sensor histidine kinase BaeS
VMRVDAEGPLADPSNADAVARRCRSDAVRATLAQYTAPTAQLYLSSPPSPQRSWFDSAGGTRILLALLLVLLVTVLAAALGARRLLRPIRSLTRAAQRMTTGELHARVLVRGGDEIARLGTAFNTMADSLERNERQRKTLVSDIAHELRNPLANVRCQLEAAQDDLVRMDGELVGSLLEETTQLQHLIDDLQDLALADAGRLLMHRETADVVALTAGVVGAHRATAESAGVTLEFSSAGPTLLWIDHVRIRQAVANLVSNAIRYTPPGGSVTVSVGATADTVTISVDDTGRGISRDDLPHLFDRFFRSDASRSRSTGGSGLGLAITRHLVEAHGGAIDVRSALGRGSQFSIRLPLQAIDGLGSTTPARFESDHART